MKLNLKRLGIIFWLVCTCTWGWGCNRTAQVVYTENTVVIVNGQAITEQHIQNETIKREITTKTLQKMKELDSTIQPPTTGILKGLELTENELSDDQKRYIASLERNYPDKPITPNFVFNQSVRQEVLYQEAVKQGYLVSKEETQEILKQMNTASDQAGATDSNFAKLKEANQAILKEYGFNSEDDYFKWNISETARSMTIQRMENKFDEIITTQNPGLEWFPLEIARYNAWEDYTEFLVKNSKIDVNQDGYKLEYYGKPWAAGRLDLKQQ